MTNPGRPEYTDDQYQTWLDDMSPFLKLGHSINYAIEKAALSKHKTAIYEKSRLNDWFSEKIDAFQRYPGEIVNSIFVRVIMIANDKVKQGIPLSDEEWRIIRFFAEKHRSCQPFFVSRHEVAQVEPNKISQILDDIERENIEADNKNLAEYAKRELEKMQAASNLNKKSDTASSPSVSPDNTVVM